jgi:DNA polymerase-3 subunit delta'
MSWKSVIGQDRIKQLLKASLGSGRLAHAYLFTGEEGLSKFSVALELAKSVNCRQSPYDACDKCPSCSGMNELQHPNLHLIFPLPRGKNEESHDSPLAKLTEADLKAIKEELKRKAEDPFHRIRLEKATEIKVNSIREVRRQAVLTSFGLGRKVFIILDAEKMNKEAANALLKTLEEPTPDTLVILITTRREMLLPTIISRCQTVKFDPLSQDDIKTALTERYAIPEDDAAAAARIADGSFTRALRSVDPDVSSKREQAVNFLMTILTGSRREINESIIKLDYDSDRSDFTEMFLHLQQWLRDAMTVREDVAVGRVTADSKHIDKINKDLPGWDYPKAVEVLERSISLVDKNVYIPLILMNVAYGLRRAIGKLKAS